MPTVLVFLGALVTILILLKRLADAGIGLGGLNPFPTRRSRTWRKGNEGNPVLAIESPMEASALLMVATAKMDGGMAAEQRDGILSLFESVFHLSRQDATELLRTSVHLHGRGDEVRDNVDAVLAPSLANFTDAQAGSVLKLLERVAGLDGPASEAQSEFIAAVRRGLAAQAESTRSSP